MVLSLNQLILFWQYMVPGKLNLQWRGGNKFVTFKVEIRISQMTHYTIIIWSHHVGLSSGIIDHYTIIIIRDSSED